VCLLPAPIDFSVILAFGINPIGAGKDGTRRTGSMCFTSKDGSAGCGRQPKAG